MKLSHTLPYTNSQARLEAGGKKEKRNIPESRAVLCFPAYISIQHSPTSRTGLLTRRGRCAYDYQIHLQWAELDIFLT